MLIEHRVYTLSLGLTDSFWEAQALRGERLEPITSRLLGSFSTDSGASDQIVSLYAWSDLDDGQVRLQQVYGNAELQPYFQAVRPMITRQSNKLMRPAPLPFLPQWRVPEGVEARGQGPALFEETCWTLRAGGLPACWEAMRSSGLAEDEDWQTPLLGVFSSVAGPLNQVSFYRGFADAAVRQAHQDALKSNSAWQMFVTVLRPWLIERQTTLLTPAPCRDMAPGQLPGSVLGAREPALQEVGTS